jgi:hypothetical protein
MLLIKLRGHTNIKPYPFPNFDSILAQILPGPIKIEVNVTKNGAIMELQGYCKGK